MPCVRLQRLDSQPGLSYQKQIQYSSLLILKVSLSNERRSIYFQSIKNSFYLACLSMSRRFSTIKLKDRDEDKHSSDLAKQNGIVSHYLYLIMSYRFE